MTTREKYLDNKNFFRNYHHISNDIERKVGDDDHKKIIKAKNVFAI